MKTDWKKVGVIGIDAGLCWIGDPCYLTADSSENPAKTWEEFCKKLPNKAMSKQWNYKMGHPGLGVSVSTGYGDGEYNVYVKKNDEGRIAEVKVVFIED
jgi:hypothetical protein